MLVKDNKRCSSCRLQKPLPEFYKKAEAKDGLNSRCKSCELHGKSLDYEKHLERYMFHRAKRRAKAKGMDFNIEVSDIVIPELCPIFNLAMETQGVYAPSIDRIDATQGYVKGNIRVISYRANVLRGDATTAELELLLKDSRRIDDEHT